MKSDTPAKQAGQVTRRGILGALTAASMTACAPANMQTLSSDKPMARGTFAHGIASGDPTPTQIILWTRITPEDASILSVSVTWEIATQKDFKSIVTSGSVDTNATRNWTVKVDALGLEPGQRYYYRFSLGENVSPIGQTKTLPKGSLDSVRFAVVSCSNWQHGFFNVYDYISRQDHFDALLHLGDYFYEYGAENYMETKAGQQGRLHEPRHEIISLEDYRVRHAQYRTDPALQAISAKMPLITIWDDHESSNDSYVEGAENHNAGEGNWDTRKAVALRAYYEWMPIREPQAGRLKEEIFRSYDYGDLLTLVTVETRLLARTEPLIFENVADEINADPEKYKAEVLNDPAREMMGAAQIEFVTEALSSSKQRGVPWRLIANQVVMGRVLMTDMAPYIDEAALEALSKDWPGVRDVVGLSKYNLPVYPDSWDGYPAARERFYDALKAKGVEDIFVITGDSHEYWVNDLTTNTGDQMGIEMGVTSVSSETLAKYMGDGTADYNLLITQSNPDVRYYNALHNGFLDLKFSKNQCEAKLIAVNTVLSKTYEAFETASFTVRPQKDTIKVEAPKGLNLKQRALFSGLG